MTALASMLRRGQRSAVSEAISINDLASLLSSFAFNGNEYLLSGLNQTLQAGSEPVAGGFQGLVRGAYKRNGVIFACVLVRLLLFSEARFQFQQLRSGRPGNLFGSAELGVLETPWPNGTTGDLLARMEQDASFAGNAFVARPFVQRGGLVTGVRSSVLTRLRPDWVTIVAGSKLAGEASVWDPDAQVLGYGYTPGGPHSGLEPVFYERDEVAHFAPIPDPESRFTGMSWLSPLIREIEADGAATRHKLKFFEQGATPNLVVKTKIADKAKFDVFVEAFRKANEGLSNAYKTMLLSDGADVTPVGADLQQLEFKVTQGAGETRIAAAAGVPPVIVGLSEGLQAATYSNYGQARRRFADGTMRPLWRNAAGSLATIVNVPQGTRLWYDDRDIAFLKEDLKDAAEIASTKSQAMRTLVEAGFKPDSVVAAIEGGDLSLLVHSGLVSVQLQPPGTRFTPNQNGNTNGRAHDGDLVLAT